LAQELAPKAPSCSASARHCYTVQVQDIVTDELLNVLIVLAVQQLCGDG